MPGGLFGFSIRDRSKELSPVTVHIGEVTGATLPGLLTGTGNLRTATAAIIMGVIARDRLLVFDNALDNTKPTSPWANRENKFLVRYRDNQAMFGLVPNEGFGDVFTTEIATPNMELTGLLGEGDFVNLGQTEIAAWITAFQAVARSKHGGTVVVDSIEYVGRNN